MPFKYQPGLHDRHADQGADIQSDYGQSRDHQKDIDFDLEAALEVERAEAEEEEDAIESVVTTMTRKMDPLLAGSLRIANAGHTSPSPYAASSAPHPVRSRHSEAGTSSNRHTSDHRLGDGASRGGHGAGAGAGAEAGKSKGKGRQREVFSIDDSSGDDQAEFGEGGLYEDDGLGSNAETLDEVLAAIKQYENEIDSINEQINELARARDAAVKEKNELQATYRASIAQQQRRAESGVPSLAEQGASQRNRHQKKAIDYGDSSNFPSWKNKLDSVLSKVFNIKNLRLCQEGVLNAVIDGRDVICIMPTGGGKSVCFQAPAVLSEGCTIVISPLISLMSDQVMHLREKGVEAVMITGSTPKDEINDIHRRLQMTQRGGTGSSREKPIKLCYVTPEKMAKSKQFMNVLSKMNALGLLARFAIDESHCCSQLGHDFRPDYKKLSTLKQYFPLVPIIALTATCGKSVLADVVRILRLKECTPGESAQPNKTVFFSAPLYRKNLHYSVKTKPSNASAVIQEMADDILANHPNDTGIIYCLSQKDTATVAEGLYKASNGKIKTGTYHAAMDDHEKQRIHERWRRGQVKCVVATIAFGLGIDAPDVRYVFHHSLSKSMEGYYQESGRAGRDGKDSDCVLYFRPADASRLSTLTVGEVEGHTKLYKMLDYALDYTTCRKLLFDNYFGNPASVVAPFSSSDRSPCGHCDNCRRGASAAASAGGLTVTTRTVTDEAWKVCKIVQAMHRKMGRVTLPQACDLVRGLAKATFGTRDGEGKAGKDSLDLGEVCGGKVTLNKDDTEILLLQLLMKGYLKEDFYATAYSTISYVIPGPNAVRLSRLRAEQLSDNATPIQISTLATQKTTTASKRSKGGKKKATDLDFDEDDGSADESEEPASKKAKTSKPALKVGGTNSGGSSGSRRKAVQDYDDFDLDEDEFEDNFHEVGASQGGFDGRRASREVGGNYAPSVSLDAKGRRVIDIDDDEDELV